MNLKGRAARLAIGLLFLLGGPAPLLGAGVPDRDIIETIRAAGTFNTLVSALESTSLVRVLKQPGPFTLFAPTDDAFVKLSPGDFAALLRDPERLVAVLKRHIVREKVTSADLARRTTIEPVLGESIRVAFGAYGIKLDGVSVVRADLVASNGVVHVIDAVLPSR
jgi:uncharacterized surface protein with fasciclin (FAS1) repeats